MNREQLNQSNQTNILSAGKVTKNRHWTHNDNIADYVDGSIEALPEDAAFIGEVVSSSGIQTAISNANTAAENANEAASNIPSTETIVSAVLDSDPIKDIEATANGALQVVSVEFASSISPTGADGVILADKDDTPNGDGTESQFIRHNNKLFYLVAVEQ